VLVELAVANLGVISDLRITFEDGMTALTGETGAGKTMIVEALSLLCGGRADPTRVRAGADESVVEGLIVTGHDEFVVRRIVPRSGRSRCYVDGELVTAAALAQRVDGEIEICGQHGAVRLAGVSAQRSALDRFAGIDLGPLHRATDRRRGIEAALAELGGDERTRARELDLLRYQIAEIDAAGLTDPDEDERLDVEEDELAGAVEHRRAAASAAELISGDDGVVSTLASAAALVAHQRPLLEISDRLSSLFEELNDCGSELRRLADRLDDDPERLGEIRTRRHLLHDLRRKYGDSLGDVIRFHVELSDRLAELESHDARVAALGSELSEAVSAERAAASVVGAARRAAAGPLGRAIAARFAELAMERATVRITVGDVPVDRSAAPDGSTGSSSDGSAASGSAPDADADADIVALAGDQVEFLLSTGSGSPEGPLGRIASGGELSRVLLALYLVLSADASTVVFDEVDAGVGGATASAVGRALAGLARHRQVLVVTHLPQVAACADSQMVVAKSDDGTTTHSTLVALDRTERVIELSRMMSGTPESERARHHADELLSASSTHRSA